MTTTVSIGELASAGVLEVGDGYRTKRSEHGMPGYRILRVADVGEGTISADGPDFVSAEYRDKINSKLSEPGDVLLTTKGTVGRVAIVPEGLDPLVYSPQLCYFRVREPVKLNARYLSYWFRSAEFLRQASHRANNTDMAAYINLADIRSLELRLPDFAEQRAIAEVLGALDDKIAANARLADTARSLAEAEWRQASMHSSSQVRLRDVAVLNYGKSLPAKRRVPGNVQVVGSGGVTGTHDQSLVAGEGIVLGRKGTAGAVHWLHGPHFPIDTTYFVTPTAALSSHFLYYELKSMGLNEMNSDSAVPGLNREEAYAAAVRHPDDESMQRFNEVVPVLFDSIAQIETESASLAATRDAFLPLLMSGTVTVKDAESGVEEAV